MPGSRSELTREGIDPGSPTRGVEPEVALTGERARLVRLCARLTGDADSADDLAQETMLLAYREAARLRDPERRAAWLTGIARHLCLDWIRRRRRERARLLNLGSRDRPADEERAEARAGEIEVVAGPPDPDAELDRRELAAMVREALDRLPPDARQDLLARYLDGCPVGEIARRRGLTEAAASMRLRRARLVLRQLLAPRVRATSEESDAGAADGAWRETRVWCPWCGRRRLLSRFDARAFQLRCPDCDAAPSVFTANADRADVGDLLRDVRSVKPALSRLLAWTHRETRQALDAGPRACPRCGVRMTLALRMPEDGPSSLREFPGLTERCRACGWIAANGVGILALTLPESRQFWRQHPRIRRLPVTELEVGGVPALATGFEGVADRSRLEVVLERRAYRPLVVRRGSA